MSTIKPVAWVADLTRAQPHCVTDLRYCSWTQVERGEHLRYVPLHHLTDAQLATLEQAQSLQAQRDALLEVLRSTGLFLHHCWCDVQMNEYSFDKLNKQMGIVDAAIKAAEGE